MCDVKKCAKCKERKSVQDFGSNKAMKDGLNHYCKKCVRLVSRIRYEANPIAHRQRRRDYSAANREKIAQHRIANQAAYNEAAKRYRKDNPEKVRAHDALNNALKRGVIAKPDSCEMCGNDTDSFLLHGHHDDYSKPLEVKWLCSGCHGKHHRKHTPDVAKRAA